MQIHTISLRPYRIRSAIGLREGALLEIVDQNGNRGLGDLAPLPNRSKETLANAIEQLAERKTDLIESNCPLESLKQLHLYPSLYFALESALLSLVDPLPDYQIPASALFMGSPEQILAQAALRQAEGFTTAKLKVSNLSFEEASSVIHTLKDRFRLRIDVNQAWETQDSLRFFSHFSQEDFEYVEDPFKNPFELAQFTHPLAVDEAFLNVLSLKQLEALPQLKAVIFKPTCNGGLAHCLPLQSWAAKHHLQFILGSSFESDVGLSCIASLSHRLSLSSPIGIGTYHHMQEHLLTPPLQLIKGMFLQPSEKMPMCVLGD